jgi:hypothetical protein
MLSMNSPQRSGLSIPGKGTVPPMHEEHTRSVAKPTGRCPMGERMHRCGYCQRSIWGHRVDSGGAWCTDGNLSGSFSDDEIRGVLETLGEVPPVDQEALF